MPPTPEPRPILLSDLSLGASNLKCFGDTPIGFDTIVPINIAIGRNNTGKSTLLDLVEYAVTPAPLDGALGRGGRIPVIYLDVPMRADLLNNVRDDVVRVPVSGNAFVDVETRKWAEKRLKDARIRFQIPADGKPTADCILDIVPKDDVEKARNQAVLAAIRRPARYFDKCHFRRIAADRDIQPELVRSDMTVASNGAGATNMLRAYTTINSFDAQLVETTLLAELNDILKPDVNFTRITTLKHNDSDLWEIYLYENTKGRVSLSRTGSGIKTILLVLINILVLPRYANQSLKDYIFAFEELENNLHPAAQRNLFRYLRRIAEEHGCRFFLTTHSNVVIDLFAHDDKAQILHVTHDGTEAKVQRYNSSSHGWKILDDLDIRASDLLQSNAVVWVEGPSDRIYVNKWIELWSDGRLKEGVHYQCLFYGGSSRAHLTFEEAEDVDELIAAVNVNRHAIFVADSDQSASGEILNDELDRLSREVDAVGGYALITQGRTIENYIPDAVWKSLTKNEAVVAPDRFADALDYAAAQMGKGQKKVKFASKVAPLLTREMLCEVGLGHELDQVCNRLYNWNNVEVLGSVTQTIVAS